MILRRFMQHIREQNWFAVGLDVIVVIVGIFLGLQVQAWYEERDERLQETRALEALQEEINQRLVIKENARSNILERYEGLTSSLNVIFDETIPPVLEQEQCTAVWTSHVLEWSFLPLVGVSELIASGKLDIIQSNKLRLKILEYSNGISEWEVNAQNIRLGTNLLIDDYSDILVRKLVDGQDVVICDGEKMRENGSFLNRLQSNRARIGDIGVKLLAEIALLKQINELIENNLQE